MKALKRENRLTGVCLIFAVFVLVLVLFLINTVTSHTYNQITDAGTYVFRLPLSVDNIKNRLTKDELTEVKGNEWVSQASGIHSITSRVSTQTQSRQAWIHYSDDGLLQLMNLKLEQGSYINKYDVDSVAQVAVINTTLRDQLFIEKNVVGNHVYINEKPYTIVGIIEEDESILSQLASDGLGSVYIPESSHGFSTVVIRCLKPYELISGIGSVDIMDKIDYFVQYNYYESFKQLFLIREIYELLFVLLILIGTISLVYKLIVSGIDYSRASKSVTPYASHNDEDYGIYKRLLLFMILYFIIATTYFIIYGIKFEFISDFIYKFSENNSFSIGSLLEAMISRAQISNRYIFSSRLYVDRWVALTKAAFFMQFGIGLTMAVFLVFINNISLKRLTTGRHLACILVGLILGLGIGGIIANALSFSIYFYFPTYILFYFVVHLLKFEILEARPHRQEENIYAG
ncbi:MAG: ABC transporter permease [Clostridia bacterium]|nr:ABC transporter permease [Clostridia bacterium]